MTVGPIASVVSYRDLSRLLAPTVFMYSVIAAASIRTLLDPVQWRGHATAEGCDQQTCACPQRPSAAELAGLIEAAAGGKEIRNAEDVDGSSCMAARS